MPQRALPPYLFPAARRDLFGRETAVQRRVPLGGDARLDGRQIVEACLCLFSGAERTSAAVGSRINHSFPLVSVFATPPDRHMTAVGDRLRRERSVSRRVPFAQQRFFVVLPAIVKETLSHVRLRSASACGERCRWRCFWLTFPAQTGQPVRFFAFVRFEIAVRQTCPSGQSHQTFLLLNEVT